MDYVNYKGTTGFVSPTGFLTKPMDKKCMVQSVRGLAENMLEAGMEDELLSTKELLFFKESDLDSPWSPATNTLLMTLAAF